MKTCAAVVATALAAYPAAAWAHHFMGNALPRTFPQGLLSGLGHPLIGVDHAAFIVAAGFLVGLVRRGMRGIVALVVGSLAGAALHLSGIGLPGGEIGVALSVILVGALVAARRRIELPWLCGGLALAGALHGHAYAESIFGAEPAPLFAYLVGFSFVQFGVAAAAFRIHQHLAAIREAWTRQIAAALGVLAGTIGVVFLINTIAA